MALFIRRNTKKPAWLNETRHFCRDAGIKIMAWGPDLLTVEAKTQDRGKEIASQLSQLGFKVVESEDDSYAGMLSLSQNPAAIRAKIASFNISRRRWDEQLRPIIWAFGALLLVPHLDTNSGRYPYWMTLPLGMLSVFMFFWDGIRIWGWRLEMLSEGFRVRRYFRWSAEIPWEQIKTVDSTPIRSESSQERVTVQMLSRASEPLGTFDCAFSRNLRDRLRYELGRQQPQPH